MVTYVYFCLFILGLIIGSFLNVVILRFDTGASIANGRSKCFSCGRELVWYELFPLVSFLVLGGKCRTCGTKISWQYPLVELSSGLLFMLAYSLVPLSAQGMYQIGFFALIAAIFSLYIVICVYDIRHKIIPDVFSYAVAVLGLGLIALEYGMTGVIDPYRLLAGPILFTFFFLFWFISKGTWMGFGDAKLALSVGWILGLWGGVAAILFAFWIGAIVSLAIIGFQKFYLKQRALTLKSEIPFGPYILLGFLLVFTFGISIQTILLFLAV